MLCRRAIPRWDDSCHRFVIFDTLKAASLPSMKNFLSLVKFSHTIFAMPFAMVGFFIGTTVAGGQFNWQKLVLVV